MKLEEVIQQTPELTEEKLKNSIKDLIKYLRNSTTDRLRILHKILPLEEAILKEWDDINAKTSLLTKSQREEVSGLVATCLINMTKYE